MYNNCMSDYIARPLAESILHARRKAVILEGARAVGKTMMAQRQLVGVGFSYETLRMPTHTNWRKPICMDGWSP